VVVVPRSQNVISCRGDSFGEHCDVEGDRVSLLEGHGQALETEILFPSCLCTVIMVMNRTLHKLYGHAGTCARCL